MSKRGKEAIERHIGSGTWEPVSGWNAAKERFRNLRKELSDMRMKNLFSRSRSKE